MPNCPVNITSKFLCACFSSTHCIDMSYHNSPTKITTTQGIPTHKIGDAYQGIGLTLST